MTISQPYKTFVLNKIVAETHQIQIFGWKPTPQSSPQQNFLIFWVGINLRGNKEACPYTAIKSNNMMYF